MFDFFDFLGFCGVALQLGAYARVQLRREFAKHLSYSVMNFLGAGFLVISLLNKWNMASFTGNMIWVLISVYGIYRCLKYIRRSKRKKARAG